jgi:SnoaL-like domain
MKHMALTLSVEDHIEIQQLYSRYAVSFDLHDAETWLACYTEDGSLEWGPGGESIGWPPAATTGKDALRALAKRSMSLSDRKGYHWNANLVVDKTPRGAHGQAYLMFVRSPNGLGELYIATHYSDELVKQDGEWLFKRRCIQFLQD